VHAYVGRRGLAIRVPQFRARVGGAANMRKILSALTVTEKVGPGRPSGAPKKKRPAYEIRNGMLIIPRIKGKQFLTTKTREGKFLIDAIVDGKTYDTVLPEPRRLDPERLNVTTPFYSYQDAVINHLCDEGGQFNSPDDPCSGVAYLSMDTGLGKSRVGCGVIARCGMPALIVVPTCAIAVQWIEEFTTIYPKITTTIYKNPPKNSKKIPPSPETHDVILIVVNTFRKKEPEFMEGFGTVVLDEAHEYHSTHNCRALWLSQTRVVLGLSATPDGRPDGLDKYVTLHLGKPICGSDIPAYDASSVNFKCNVSIINYTGHPDHCETVIGATGMTSAILTIGSIIGDIPRLRMIASEVRRLYYLHETSTPAELLRLGLGPRPACDEALPKYPEGGIRRHGIFVFAEHRDYLPTIRMFIEMEMGTNTIYCPEMDEDIPTNSTAVSLLRGGVASTAVGSARSAGSHIVLTTYGYSRRGISLPDMTAIVKATPRRNGTRQIDGRMLRRGSDESIVRQIIDVVDKCTKLGTQSTSRCKVYRERGFVIKRTKKSWVDYIQPGDAVPNAAAIDDESDDEFDTMDTDALFDEICV